MKFKYSKSYKNKHTSFWIMRVYNTGNHFEMVFVGSSSDIVPSLYERLPHAAEVIKNNNPSNTS